MKKPLETARETPQWQDSYVSKFELFELLELLSRHPPRVQLGWPGQQIEEQVSNARPRQEAVSQVLRSGLLSLVKERNNSLSLPLLTAAASDP